MKKRILSLVLCAAMLLSMCLFLGAGVAEDTTADGSAESTESYVPAVNFTNVAPLVQANAQAANGPARAPLRAGANDGSATPTDPLRKTSDAVVTSKTATANDDDTYTITLEAYATGSKVITEIQKDVPTDIVLVLDQSGSMADCIVCGKEIDKNSTHTVYTYTAAYNPNTQYNYYIIVDGDYKEVQYGNIGSRWNPDYEWYYTTGSWYNQTTHKVSPKTGENDTDSSHIQFYTRTGTKEACTSRLDALKTALNTFTEAVKTKAAGADGVLGTGDDVNHRIAMVGFASDERGNTKYQNTELLTTSSVVNYQNAQSTDYKNALVSVLDENGNLNSRIVNAVNGLAASGGTAIDLGTEMANNVLKQHKNETGRNKVVIIFTDGVPGIKTDDSNGTRDEYANRAIANTLKAKRSATEASAPGYGATVYTVGVFDGADASTPGQLSNATNWGDNGRPNRFMHLLSSNYPVAENMSTTGAVKSDLNGKSYYLSAADAKSLKNIFQQISDQIETGGSSTTLNSEAVIKDIISPQFQLPKGTTAQDIQLETYACTEKNGDTYTWSKNADAMGAKATVENGTVSVTGFDFAKNYVGTVTENGKVTYRGDKLVISFNVEPKDGFLGGNDVFTNDGAYIYDKSTATEPVRTFDDKPQVNVRIKDVTVTATDKNVYLLGSLTADELKADATVKVGDVTLDLTKANDSECPYGLEKWQTDYVNITVAVKDEADNAITDTGLSNLTDDTKYTVSVTVAPKTESPTSKEGTQAVDKRGTATPNVNVFKPELTFKDSEGYYGDTAPTSFKGNLTATAWKHGDTVADNTIPMGKVPELTLAFTPDTDAVMDGKINTRTDFGVDVTVKIDNTEVTEETVFHHKDCAGKTCELTGGKEFLVHVNTCSLTISKTVTGQNNGQSFVFTVKDANGNVITTVAVKGGASKTITGLPIGTYTVTEDTHWSWQYNLTSGNEVTKKLKANAAEDYAAADFTNEYKGTNWLTSIADVINKWVSATQIQQIPDPKTN